VSEAQDRYRAVADGFTARLRGVPPDGWSASTPCTEWTVRDLVAHVIDTHRRVMGALDGSTPVEVDRGADLAGQWRDASGAVSEALDDPARATRIVGGPFGEQPFESLVGRVVCTDTLVHTWDLARATGQDESLEPEAVASSREFLAGIDEMIRRPGGFAARIEPAPDADEQTRLLNFAGRAV
jgi:uncharacterized protein (TIGR03086 family)